MARMICGPHLLDPYGRPEGLYLELIDGIAIAVMIHGGYVHLSYCSGHRRLYITPGCIPQEHITRAIPARVIGKRSIMNDEDIAQAVLIRPGLSVSCINRGKMLLYGAVLTRPYPAIGFYILYIAAGVMSRLV